MYDYYLDLGPAGLNDPFVASANTTYWISIVQNLRGTPHTWFWAEADSGDVNGRSAVRERVDTQWSLSHAATDDHAFDLLSTGTSTVYAAKSVDAASAAYTATGLGYYFDSNQAYISGFRPEDEPGAEFDMTHWRGVRAPWKRFGNIAVTPVPADADGAAAAFAEAGIAITEDEINALVDDADGLIIQGVFEGLAAFDANDAIYGVDVGGRIDRLCNQQVIDEVAPSDALNERLQVKGVRMTGPPSPAGEQVARAVLEPIAAPECFFDFECFPRPNVCYTPRCRDQAAVDRGLCSADEIGTCFVMPRGYGDVNEDGIGPKVFDIIAQLAVIGEGGDTEQATAEQADIHPCDGNGTVNVQDIFAALDVLEGIDVCCGQYSPFACCVGDTCTLAQRADCETAGGLIVAGVGSCTPNPCPLGSAPAGDRSFEFAGRSAQHRPVPVEIKLVPEAR